MPCQLNFRLASMTVVAVESPEAVAEQLVPVFWAVLPVVEAEVMWAWVLTLVEAAVMSESSQSSATLYC